MKTDFVEGLSTTTRLMAAVSATENRGAPETSWVLAQGEVGYGKSRAVARLAVAKDGIFVRAKAEWTPLWALHDIGSELGLQRLHRKEPMLTAIVEELRRTQPRILAIDEIDYAARKFEVLETLRDITDISECVLLASGMKGASALIRRYPQIYDRIYETVTFGAATVDDIKLMCAKLCDVKIADDLAAHIQIRTGGKLRNVMNALGRIEAYGRKARTNKITLDDWGKRPLSKDDPKGEPNG
jgi:hypothetical protein